MTTYQKTADASLEYRERTGVLVASSTSAADTGNLAAATRDTTFNWGPFEVIQAVEPPRSQATAVRR